MAKDRTKKERYTDRRGAGRLLGSKKWQGVGAIAGVIGLVMALIIAFLELSRKAEDNPNIQGNCIVTGGSISADGNINMNCPGGQVEPTQSPTSPQPSPAGQAPWDNPQLSEGRFPTIVAAWRKAANHESCAPIGPSDLGIDVKAKPRPARFLGGWGVTYEALGGNFTIAGTDQPANEGVDPITPWQYHISWDDGSIAGYGIEGAGGEHLSGTDATSYIAYLAIKGQRCLYNISTARGKRHLEHLLRSLRLINVEKDRSVIF